MSFGKAYILKIDGCVHDGWLTFRFNNDLLFSELLLYFLNGSYDKFKEKAVGTGVKNLNTTRVKETLVPLPPLYEQKRIVEKIDGLFKLIDNLDTDKKKLLETIELTRNKVLQDAIQGKLVEQDPNDEPASELLKKIEAEKKKLYKEGKIRKPKKLPPIKDEEKPFEIPESWEWVRLGNICYKLTDGSHNPPKGIDGRGYPMISAVNINKKIDFTKPSRIISKKDFEKEHRRTNISKNDILLTTVGTIGRTIVVETNKQFTVQRSVAVVNTGLYPHYVKLFFNSPFFYNQMINNAKGTAQLGIYLGKLSNLIVCCSPLEEQKKW
jgi:type I restriction enzyme S subunit